MHVLLVYCHPEPQSFTHALLERACEVLDRQCITYDVSDLHGEGFNPVAGRHDFTSVAREDYFHYQTEQYHAAEHGTYSSELQREQDRVRRANVMIFLFPLWGGGLPGMLKGWFDRVMAYGFAYVDGARFEKGLFRGRAAMMCLSTGGTPERFSHEGPYGPIEDLLRPFNRAQLAYLGLDVAAPYVAYASPRVGDEGRQRLLAEWETYLDGWMRERAANHPALPDLLPAKSETGWGDQT